MATNEPFPSKYQTALNLTNGSSEQRQIVEHWRDRHGGDVEHLPYHRVVLEIMQALRDAAK